MCKLSLGWVLNVEGEQQAFVRTNEKEREKQTKKPFDTHTGIRSAWSETGHHHLYRLEKQVVNWCENTHTDLCNRHLRRLDLVNTIH